MERPSRLSFFEVCFPRGYASGWYGIAPLALDKVLRALKNRLVVELAGRLGRGLLGGGAGGLYGYYAARGTKMGVVFSLIGMGLVVVRPLGM